MTRYPTAEPALGLDLRAADARRRWRSRPAGLQRAAAASSLKRKPNLTLVVHHRAAHAINFSHPQALATVVRAWLRPADRRRRGLSRRRSSSSTGRASPRIEPLPCHTLNRSTKNNVRGYEGTTRSNRTAPEYSISPMTVRLEPHTIASDAETSIGFRVRCAQSPPVVVPWRRRSGRPRLPEGGLAVGRSLTPCRSAERQRPRHRWTAAVIRRRYTVGRPRKREGA